MLHDSIVTGIWWIKYNIKHYWLSLPKGKAGMVTQSVEIIVPRFNVKTLSYQRLKSHCGDGTVNITVKKTHIWQLQYHLSHAVNSIVESHYVLDNQLWHHQQNINWPSEAITVVNVWTSSCWSSFVCWLCHVRYEIMYVLWWTIYLLTSSILSLYFTNQEINTNITLSWTHLNI